MKQPRNSVLMNYITGSALFLSGLINFNVNLSGSGRFILGIGWLIFYFAEPWAFNFKVKLSRVRVLTELTGGDPERLDKHKAVGSLITFAFFIRLIFRFLILIITSTIFGFISGKGNDEMSPWKVCIYIFAMLFELFVLFLPMFSLSSSDKDEQQDEKSKKRENEREREWRRKNFPLLSRSDTFPKELLSDILLSLYALVATKYFWGIVNETFSSYIISSGRDGSSPLGTAIFIAIPIFILTFFFLVPVRLAYWVGETIRINTASEKRQYFLSLCFATFLIILPVIQTFVNVFFKIE